MLPATDAAVCRGLRSPHRQPQLWARTTQCRDLQASPGMLGQSPSTASRWIQPPAALAGSLEAESTRRHPINRAKSSTEQPCSLSCPESASLTATKTTCVEGKHHRAEPGLPNDRLILTQAQPQPLLQDPFHERETQPSLQALM